MTDIRNTFEHVKTRIRLAGTRTQRDVLLDMAKGIAITLVVIGHTFQGQSADFDELAGFRFIYSFHMPLFALLAGASATFWVKKFNTCHSMQEIITAFRNRIRRSAASLLPPFISWTLIGYWVTNNPEPLIAYLTKVFNHPDYSLWFLPCIFWCTTFAATFMLAISILRIKLVETSHTLLASGLESFPVQMIAMFLAWKIIAPKLPVTGGIVFATEFHGGLFIHFLIGLTFFRIFTETDNKWIRTAPYILFFSLVPFWHRTLPHDIIQNAPAFLTWPWMKNNYAMMVAISGSLVFIDIARLAFSSGPQLIRSVLAYIGTASLGIYAMHLYFLGHTPHVLAAIVISLAIWQTALFIPVARSLLFGK